MANHFLKKSRKTVLHVVKPLAKVQLADGEAVKITELRLAVWRNSYLPISTRDKRTLLKEWNSIVPTAEVITGYFQSQRAGATLHPATGLQIAGRIVAMDGDFPDPAISGECRLAMRSIAPQLFEAGSGHHPALERGRDDGSPKFMLFARRAGDAARFTIKSKKWSLNPEDEEAPTFQLEVFSSERNREGKVARQVGCFGPHTVCDESGIVKIRYQWKGPSPAEVPLNALPELAESQALAIAAEVDRILEAHGYKALKGHRGGKFVPTDVYDLDEHTRFDGEEFDQITLEELIELYWQNQEIGADTRCSGSFTGEGGTRQDRCHVGWAGPKFGGHLTVFDYATEICHRPTAADPKMQLSPLFVAEMQAILAAFNGEG